MGDYAGSAQMPAALWEFRVEKDIGLCPVGSRRVERTGCHVEQHIGLCPVGLHNAELVGFRVEERTRALEHWSFWEAVARRRLDGRSQAAFSR